MKKLIINADDLGFSPAVNEAIISTAEYGTVRAASLMVTMPFAEDAVTMVSQRCPDLDIGLHFSLTSGRSVSPPETVPLLVDTRGNFHLGFVGLWRLLVSKKKMEAMSQIRCEWDAQLAQIDRLQQKYAFRLNHLDSHQHIHVLPGILEMLCSESQKRHLHLRIPRERIGCLRRLMQRFPSWFAGGLAKRMILSQNLNRHDFRPLLPIGYFGILDSGKIDENALRKIFDAIEKDHSDNRYFEINVHPSLPIAQRHTSPLVDLAASRDDRRFHCSVWREKEWQTLTNDRILKMLEHYRLSLSGFPNGSLLNFGRKPLF